MLRLKEFPFERQIMVKSQSFCLQSLRWYLGMFSEQFVLSKNSNWSKSLKPIWHKKISILKFLITRSVIYIFGVLRLAIYVFFLFSNEPELGDGIDPGMAIYPFPSSNLDETRFEPTTFWSWVKSLTTKPDWRLVEVYFIL